MKEKAFCWYTYRHTFSCWNGGWHLIQIWQFGDAIILQPSSNHEPLWNFCLSEHPSMYNATYIVILLQVSSSIIAHFFISIDLRWSGITWASNTVCYGSAIERSTPLVLSWWQTSRAMVHFGPDSTFRTHQRSFSGSQECFRRFDQSKW